MKRIIILIGLLLFITFSCKKEELVITDVPLELDENSEEYQQYLVERAMEFIKTYRLEKVDSLVEKLSNENEKKRILDSLLVYKARAPFDAFYFVTEKNDSLFFLDPKIRNEDQISSLTLSFVGMPPFTSNLFNAKGVLHGFKRFPKLTELIVENSLGTGIAEIENLADLKTLSWNVDRAAMEQQFPQQEFEYVPLKADLSKNLKLKVLNFKNINSRNLVFPDYKLESVRFEQSDINATNNLDALKAGTLTLMSDKASNPGFVLKNNQIDIFRIEAVNNLGEKFSSNIKSVDITETNIAQFIVRDATSIEKITLNDELEKLDFEILEYGDQAFSGKLTEVSNYPAGLQSIKLVTKELKQQNFSNLSKLQSLHVSGENQDYNLTLPSGLQTLYVFNANKCNLNLSQSTALQSATVSASSSINLGTIPAGLQSLGLMNSGSGNISLGALDFSGNTQLSELSIYKFNLSDIKFPATMTNLSLGGGTSLPANIKFPDALSFLSLRELPELGGSIKFPAVVSDVSISNIDNISANLDFQSGVSSLTLSDIGTISSELKAAEGLSTLSVSNITSMGGLKLPNNIGYVMLSNISRIASEPVMPTNVQMLTLQNISDMPSTLSLSGFWRLAIENVSRLATLDFSSHDDLGSAYAQVRITGNNDLKEIIFPTNYWESMNVLVVNDYGDIYENLTPDMQARCEDGLFRQMFDITVKKDCKTTNLPEKFKKYIKYSN